MGNQTQATDLARWRRRRAAGMVGVLVVTAAVAVLIGCQHVPLVKERYLADEVRRARTPAEERQAFRHVNERSTWHAVRLFDTDNLLIPQSARDQAGFVEIEWDDGTVVRRQVLDRDNLDALFPR